MTTDPTTESTHPRPDLPAPFDAAEVRADVKNGQRKITLTLPPDGVLHRCRYQRAWIELVEREPWSGDPTLMATRHLRHTGHDWFTDAATRRIVEDLMPPVFRYGWARWWDELHRRRTPHLDPKEMADHASRIRRWWLLLDNLQRAYAAGHITLDPIRDVRDAPRQRQLDVWGNATREPVIAAAIQRGEPVGWLTERGDLVPPGHVLDPPPSAAQQ